MNSRRRVALVRIPYGYSKKAFALSFRHATQRTPKAHFIRFGKPLPRATFLPEEGYVAAR